MVALDPAVLVHENISVVPVSKSTVPPLGLRLVKSFPEAEFENNVLPAVGEVNEDSGLENVRSVGIWDPIITGVPVGGAEVLTVSRFVRMSVEERSDVELTVSDVVFVCVLVEDIVPTIFVPFIDPESATPTTLFVTLAPMMVSVV